MSRRSVLFLGLLGFLLPAIAVAQTGNYNFTTIDYPGIIGNTIPTAINDAGLVVGSYTDTQSVTHGFIYSGNGQYTSFDAPGNGTLGTYVYGVNNAGVITGYFEDSNGAHGFIKAGQQFTQLDFGLDEATVVYGINNNGEVDGWYASSQGVQSFIYNYNTQVLTFISCSGAPIETWGINDQSQVVGPDIQGVGDAYYYNQGVCTTINYPGLSTTVAAGINNNGLVAGYADDGSDGDAVSFLWVTSSQQFITINYSSPIGILGINNNADITGVYLIGDVPHGFIGNPAGQANYTLTVTTTGSGTVTSTDGHISCPPNCSFTYPANTNVSLNAQPAAGNVFVTWSGACDGSGACTVTMNQDQTVGAVFSAGLQFVSLTPCRVVDTRNPDGPFGGPPIPGGTSRSFTLPQGQCNIPASAQAYSLNVTVVPQGPLHYLTIWPTGENQPAISTINSRDGRTKATAAIVAAGTSGAVSVYATDTTNVLLDIDGYFAAPGGQSLQFYPLTPCRIVDTRQQNGPLGGPYLQANVERDFPIPQSSCIPSGLSASAYSFNVTAVPHPAHERLGYLTVWPAGAPQPVVSTLNNPTGTTVANAAIVPAGTGGAVAVFPNGDTDLLIDINGYFGTPGSGGLSLYPTAPCRALDTRNVGNGQPFIGELTVNISGGPCAPPSGAQAYVFNATVVPPGALGYLTLWPDGDDQPLVSTLNAADGSVTSNMAIVPTSNGSIDAYASALTQLILDISSYFAP